MPSLRRALSRILADIGEGRHIESYAIVLVAFALAVIGLIDDVIPQSVKFAVMLAALALLVFQTTKPDERPVDLDSVLRDRQRFSPFRDFIQGGRVLWLYGASAGNILRHDADIKREILGNGGQIRVLMQHPDAPGMDSLPRQYDDVHPLRDDIHTSLRTLKNMSERLATGTLDYGLLDHNPGYSLAIIDPQGPNGRLVVEFHGYDNAFITDRMHIVITRQQSQHWFDYWVGQFDAMWAARQMPDNGT